jgi:hypothetical protein
MLAREGPMANTSARPNGFSSQRQTRRAQWQTILEECRWSGLSQTEFCRRRGIPPGTLSCWKHKLRGAHGRGARAAAMAVPARPAFVPVHLTATAPSAARFGAGPTAWDGELEITLADGRQVRMRGRVDPEWLGQIVRTLERPGC